MTAMMNPAPFTAAPHARIVGLGTYRPGRLVSNEEICEHIDSSDLWIRTRSGIVNRRWASDEETVRAMAVAAGGKALAHAGVRPDQVGCVLVGSVSHLHQTPALATLVGADIGTRPAAALDLNAGCAAFCYGLELAQSLIRSGAVGQPGTGPIGTDGSVDRPYVLLIGVERLSDLTDVEDRSTAFLFGDGAGAVVIGPSDTPGIGPAVWGADGAQAEVISQTCAWDEAVATGRRPAITMEGKRVFRWASYDIARAAKSAIERAGIRPEDLAAFVPHQANMRITDAMARTLGLPETVAIARDIADQGNTSAASIPLAMDTLLAADEGLRGRLALLVGFGSGLAYAAQVAVLP